MKKSYYFIALAAVMVLSLVIDPLHAQWSNNPTVNNPICTQPQEQSFPRISAVINIAGVGMDGAIFTWRDRRNGFNNFDIYAQRVTGAGNLVGPVDGVPICTETGHQTDVAILGQVLGAIIVWRDDRNPLTAGDIYAQRIDANGQPLWAPNGVPICTQVDHQGEPIITSDGSGGAIIAWQDSRLPPGTDIFAQRINANGQVQWPANGIQVTFSGDPQQISPNQFGQLILGDGSGGAIIAWRDANLSADPDIRAQRISGTGQLLWPGTNGILISNTPASTIFCDDPAITPFGGGAIIAWTALNAPFGTPDVFAHRINNDGTFGWLSPVAICQAPSHQYHVRIAGAYEGGAGGQSGAYITWMDLRNGNQDIYAQLITSDGNVAWQPDGIPICANSANQALPSITSTDTPLALAQKKAIISWTDYRSLGGVADIYAQKVKWNGQIEWTSNGIAVSSASGNQIRPVLTTDGSEGAIVAWMDFRNDVSGDIYAQRILASGALATTGTICGTKFNDANGNGVQDSLEAGLPGWQIVLAGPDSAFVTTDSVGNYCVTGLTAGTYTVSEILQPGWTKTLPPTPPGFYTITLAPGQVVTGVDFGNQQLTGSSSICGRKFNDVNGNGVQDSLEAGLPGWQIVLAGPDSAFVTTDSVGNYCVTGLTAGTYTVSEILQPGWTKTLPPTPPGFYTITLAPAQVVMEVDFGNMVDSTFTPMGTNVSVSPNSTTTVTFSNVTQAGNTNAVTSNTGSPPPAGFKLGSPPTYYNITTTAVFSGSITVCSNYTGVSYGNESNLKLFHFQNGAWVDVTTSLDTDTKVICGSVTSLSMFAIFEPEVCPLTQGFWKNHSDAWPVDPLTLGTVEYTKAQLLNILNTPVGGKGGSDASLILAHQLIAAKLNIANGSNPALIADTIVQADALIGSNTIPMNVRTNTSLGQQMTALAKTLDSYNNGALTPDCVPSTAALQVGSEAQKADVEIVPTRFALEQNYPNPFNPSTMIQYDLPEPTFVTLKVYDMLGREVATLVQDHRAAGRHTVQFTADQLPSGSYLYRITAGSFTQTKRVVLMK